MSILSTAYITIKMQRWCIQKQESWSLELLQLKQMCRVVPITKRGNWWLCNCFYRESRYDVKVLVIYAL